MTQEEENLQKIKLDLRQNNKFVCKISFVNILN